MPVEARLMSLPCFRPLSWGLFFNTEIIIHPKRMVKRFRPLSWGLFFNHFPERSVYLNQHLFSSPFLGTFFQWKWSLL